MQKRAFTLIELLVVIAIISILAAILFPVFAKVREKGRQTACLSNEKQLALGVQMYADDNDEVLPETQNGAFVLWPDLVNPYVRNVGVRVCPSDAAPNAVNSYGLNELIFVDATDYLPAAPPSLPILANIQTPSSTVMIGEVGTGDDFATVRANAYKLTAPDAVLNDSFDARPSARHLLHANVAFMDGHAKARLLTDFYIGQTPPDKYFCANPDNVGTCHS